ncbi:MAG TPA: hypothetical protein VHI52_00520, partial [Verrucomicrobiae bacterium]|nr:hypothetical protein [Verrucomicrobiae bacterium]
TFGLNLEFTEPYAVSPQLNLAYSNGGITLTWNRDGFTLQQASDPAGPWTNVPGPVVSSPYSPTVSGPALYFRLAK